MAEALCRERLDWWLTKDTHIGQRVRAKKVAWRTGKQHFIQPEWAESEKKFGRKTTMLSVSVATDRSGNERAVNVCKRAWFISRGFQQRMTGERMNDAWTTWAFQSNFMFDPVL